MIEFKNGHNEPPDNSSLAMFKVNTAIAYTINGGVVLKKAPTGALLII